MPHELTCGAATRGEGCGRLTRVAEPTGTQKTAVLLAFIAAGLSLAAVLITATRTGRIDATPLFGGLFMLALGIAGWSTLRRR